MDPIATHADKTRLTKDEELELYRSNIVNRARKRKKKTATPPMKKVAIFGFGSGVSDPGGGWGADLARGMGMAPSNAGGRTSSLQPNQLKSQQRFGQPTSIGHAENFKPEVTHQGQPVGSRGSSNPYAGMPGSSVPRYTSTAPAVTPTSAGGVRIQPEALEASEALEAPTDGGAGAFLASLPGNLPGLGKYLSPGMQDTLRPYAEGISKFTKGILPQGLQQGYGNMPLSWQAILPMLLGGGLLGGGTMLGRSMMGGGRRPERDRYMTRYASDRYPALTKQALGVLPLVGGALGLASGPSGNRAESGLRGVGKGFGTELGAGLGAAGGGLAGMAGGGGLGALLGLLSKDPKTREALLAAGIGGGGLLGLGAGGMYGGMKGYQGMGDLLGQPSWKRDEERQAGDRPNPFGKQSNMLVGTSGPPNVATTLHGPTFGKPAWNSVGPSHMRSGSKGQSKVTSRGPSTIPNNDPKGAKPTNTTNTMVPGASADKLAGVLKQADANMWSAWRTAEELVKAAAGDPEANAFLDQLILEYA
jgi:hypothetical protein